MDDVEIQKKYEKLKNEINFHNYQYHVLDKPIISDAQFDKMLVELRKIEGSYPEIITLDSPSQRVGMVPSSKFDKVQHPVAVRYAFKEWVKGELYNNDGLPASSFRTDNW